MELISKRRKVWESIISVKYRDISDVYNQESGDMYVQMRNPNSTSLGAKNGSNMYQITDCSSVSDLSKYLSTGQKEFLLNSIKMIVEKGEEHEQMIEKMLEKDPELLNVLTKMLDEVTNY
jgi:hypothetical protein